MENTQKFPTTINGMERGAEPEAVEGTVKNSITQRDEKDEKVKAGILWTQVAKSGKKYWSGKLPLSSMLYELVENAKIGSTPLPEETVNAMVTLAESLDRDRVADLDLLMWANQFRQKGKNHHHLNLFVKVNSGYEEVDDDNLPE